MRQRIIKISPIPPTAKELEEGGLPHNAAIAAILNHGDPTESWLVTKNRAKGIAEQIQKSQATVVSLGVYPALAAHIKNALKGQAYEFQDLEATLA